MATKEIMEACALKNINSIQPSKFFRRINEYETKSFEEIYFKQKDNVLKNNIYTLLN